MQNMDWKYYVCNHCGNVIQKVTDKGTPVSCCGELMQELVAGKVDAAVEKHVPVYTMEGDTIHITVGEVIHPMVEQHYIEWIALHTKNGIWRKYLNPGEEPKADFKLSPKDEVKEVYAYCNLHGLWKC